MWDKDGALHLNKLESPSPKDALCQVWLKLAQCIWRHENMCFIHNRRGGVEVERSLPVRDIGDRPKS